MSGENGLIKVEVHGEDRSRKRRACGSGESWGNEWWWVCVGRSESGMGGERRGWDEEVEIYTEQAGVGMRGRI